MNELNEGSSYMKKSVKSINPVESMIQTTYDNSGMPAINFTKA
jgi:hypothetical protein